MKDYEELMRLLVKLEDDAATWYVSTNRPDIGVVIDFCDSGDRVEFLPDGTWQIGKMPGG